MKIGLLSDMHGRVQMTESVLECLIKNGANYLICAGDIVSLKCLELIKESGLPYKAVLGNNDIYLIEHIQNYELFKEPHYFKIEDKSFKLMHLPYYLAPDTDVVIYGHLHKFEVSKKEKTLFINPGEVCAREKGVSECAMVEINDKKIVVSYFFRSVYSDYWHTKEYEFLSD